MKYRIMLIIASSLQIALPRQPPKKVVQVALLRWLMQYMYMSHISSFLNNTSHLFGSQIKAWWLQKGYKSNKINIRIEGNIILQTALRRVCVHILRVSIMIQMFLDCADSADLRTDMHITCSYMVLTGFLWRGQIVST